MSLYGRISELNSKHRELDKEIDQEQKRPRADSLKIAELKRQKLKIKEALREISPH
jgi:hypothetical protein